MTTLTASRAATLPSVNLLPPEIAEAAKFRRLQTMLGALIAVTILAVGALWFMAHSQAKSAQDDLTAAQQNAVGLQAQVSTYDNVPATTQELATAQVQLATAMEPEVRWSFYLNDMSLTIPDSVRLSELVVDEPYARSLGTTPQTSTGVEGGLGVGNIHYAGAATSYDAVARWLQVQTHEWGVTEPWPIDVQNPSSQTTVKPVITWSSKITVTADALSHRYDKWGN